MVRELGEVLTGGFGGPAGEDLIAVPGDLGDVGGEGVLEEYEEEALGEGC